MKKSKRDKKKIKKNKKSVGLIKQNVQKGKPKRIRRKPTNKNIGNT